MPPNLTCLLITGKLGSDQVMMLMSLLLSDGVLRTEGESDRKHTSDIVQSYEAT